MTVGGAPGRSLSLPPSLSRGSFYQHALLCTLVRKMCMRVRVTAAPTVSSYTQALRVSPPMAPAGTPPTHTLRRGYTTNKSAATPTCLRETRVS